ncbi:MAG: fasciclin domain-containing protein [Bacteroidetes bacterium]|jgi:uncharacterized surface protein with fasciclin (FAS1) repeats|nr:fasciclin domain-containing protein [Bacteroidota bacterium]
MKTFKQSIALLSGLLLLLLLPLSADAQDGEATIAEIAAGNENFSTLVTALDTAGLVGVLDGEGPFTVFAPTNEAFEALPDGELEALLQPENRELLTQILTYHVVEGEAMAADVVGLDEVTTLMGSAVSIEVDGETVRLADTAQVVQTDIEASNGVIHVIDSVLLPPTTESEEDSY